MKEILVLSYAGCSTCKKALKWFQDHKVPVTVRAIVDEPPTKKELAEWIPKAGLPIRKWFNTSGLSYRALDKGTVANASDAEIISWLSKDGKLVKRPVVVTPKAVLLGFDPANYAKYF